MCAVGLDFKEPRRFVGPQALRALTKKKRPKRNHGVSDAMWRLRHSQLQNRRELPEFRENPLDHR